MADPSGTEAESSTPPAEQASTEPQRDTTDANDTTDAVDTADTDADQPAESELVTEAMTASEQPQETADDGSSAPTDVFAQADPAPPSPPPRPERRFTAPSGYDAGSTEKIDPPPEPATEVLSVPGSPSAPTEPVAQQHAPSGPILPPKTATPQAIPPRPARRTRSWGWVLALLLVIAALVAVAILGTVWLTQKGSPRISQEDQVRTTIQNFDVAVQKGDLATLRSITCGTTRDNYVNYNDRAWAETHARVAAAKQYPVVASIDQVVVNGDHAEANVTTFMAYDPATRSTRSFDLQFRDEQWKICQAPTN